MGFAEELGASFLNKFPSNPSEPFSVGIEVAEEDLLKARFELFEVDIWQEHDRDIRLQLVPSGRRVYFPRGDTLMAQADKVFRRVFEGSCEADAKAYGPRYGGGRVSRNSDHTQAGMEMLDITLLGLFRRPGALKKVVEAVTLLDQVVRGVEMPLE